MLTKRKFTYKPILFVIVFITLLINCKLYAQVNNLKITGGNVDFIYSTLKQYETGISLNAWTKIKVSFQDTLSNGWQLRGYALSGTIEYQGEASHDIDLEDFVVDVTATVLNTSEPDLYYNTGFIVETEDPLSTDQIIASGTGGGKTEAMVEVEVIVSYTLPPMLNKPEGLYYVALRFILISI